MFADYVRLPTCWRLAYLIILQPEYRMAFENTLSNLRTNFLLPYIFQLDMVFTSCEISSLFCQDIRQNY